MRHSVEDLYEAPAEPRPTCASGSRSASRRLRLVRRAGNEDELVELAGRIALLREIGYKL